MAEKLCVSRQAISKWERGEAYPDTENLIIISNTFGITLDELVRGDLSGRDTAHENTLEEDTYEELNQDSEIFTDGDFIQLKDGDSLVAIKGGHIRVSDGETNVSVNLAIPGIHIKNIKDGTERKIKLWLCYAIPYPIVVTVAFLLIGFLAHGFYWSWTLFMTIPLYYSLLDAIKEKHPNKFAYPIFVAFLYCLLGMLLHFWHPGWIMFLTIPIYGAIAEAIDKYIHK